MIVCFSFNLVLLSTKSPFKTTNLSCLYNTHKRQIKKRADLYLIKYFVTICKTLKTEQGCIQRLINFFRSNWCRTAPDEVPALPMCHEHQSTGTWLWGPAPSSSVSHRACICHIKVLITARCRAPQTWLLRGCSTPTLQAHGTAGSKERPELERRRGCWTGEKTRASRVSKTNSLGSFICLPAYSVLSQIRPQRKPDTALAALVPCIKGSKFLVSLNQGNLRCVTLIRQIISQSLTMLKFYYILYPNQDSLVFSK